MILSNHETFKAWKIVSCLLTLLLLLFFCSASDTIHIDINELDSYTLIPGRDEELLSGVEPVRMNMDLQECLVGDKPCHFDKIGGKIPKVMHFVWYQDTDVPKIFRQVLGTWKKLHPDWKVFLWTQHECEMLIREHYSWFYEHFLNYPWMIQRIDAVRYFIIYHFGGLASDIDMAAKRNMNPLIENYINNGYDVILLPSVMDIMGGLANGFTVAAPKNHFHSKVIRNLMNPTVSNLAKYTWWFNPAKRHSWIMLSAGPRFITNEKTRYFELDEDERKSKIGFFEAHKFLPCKECAPKPCTCPDCYIIMIAGGLWHETDSRMLDRWRCFWEPLITTHLHWLLFSLASFFCVAGFMLYRYRKFIVYILFNRNSRKPMDLRN